MKFNIFKATDGELTLAARATSAERALRHTRHLARISGGWLLERGGMAAQIMPDHREYVDEEILIYIQIGTHFMCREDTQLRVTPF